MLDKKLQHLEETSGSKKISKILNDNNAFQVAGEKLWKRVKGTSRLNRNSWPSSSLSLYGAKQLAQKKDKTRRKILADDIIVNLAITPPENVTGIDQFIDRRYNFNSEEKQQLFETITASRQTPRELCPDNQFNTLDNEQKSTLKKLQQIVNEKAEELGISLPYSAPGKSWNN